MSFFYFAKTLISINLSFVAGGEMNIEVAEKLLQEAKLILPQTDTGRVNYITDCEYGKGSLHTHGEINEIKRCIESENKAIGKFISILKIQSKYESTSEIINEINEMVRVVFEDCCSKGYIESAEDILYTIALGALDSCPNFNKKDFLKRGVLSILETCGKSQIITRKEKYRRKALNIIVKAKQNYFGEINLSEKELFQAYNGVEIGSYQIRNRLTKDNLQEYQGY